MGLVKRDTWHLTVTVVILGFSTFLLFPTNNVVSGATLRNYAVLTLRDDLDNQENQQRVNSFDGGAGQVYGFSNAGKHQVGNAQHSPSFSQPPTNQQHQYNQQQHHQYQQLQQQPVEVDVKLPGGTFQNSLDQSSPLLDLGASVMPNLGGTPLQSSTFFTPSSHQQRPPSYDQATNSQKRPSQQQLSQHQQYAAQEAQNVLAPTPTSIFVQQQQYPLQHQQQRPPAQQEHPSTQQLQSSSQVQQSTSQQEQQIQDEGVHQPPPSASQLQTSEQQVTQTQPSLQQPSPPLTPPQDNPSVPSPNLSSLLQTTSSQHQEAQLSTQELPQLPALPQPQEGEQIQHSSSQQQQESSQLQHVISQVHQSPSTSQQQSQQVISEQQNYSKPPPPQESPVIEPHDQTQIQAESEQHTPIEEHPVPSAPSPVPPPQQQSPPPQQQAEELPSPSTTDLLIQHEQNELIDANPSPPISDQSQSEHEQQEVETSQEQSPAAVSPSVHPFVLIPQSSMNSPFLSNTASIFNQQPQEGSIFTLANQQNVQEQNQTFTLFQMPTSLLPQFGSSSILSHTFSQLPQLQQVPASQLMQSHMEAPPTTSDSNDQLPSSHMEAPPTTSDSNEQVPLSHMEEVQPSQLVEQHVEAPPTTSDSNEQVPASHMEEVQPPQLVEQHVEAPPTTSDSNEQVPPSPMEAPSTPSETSEQVQPSQLVEPHVEAPQTTSNSNEQVPPSQTSEQLVQPQVQTPSTPSESNEQVQPLQLVQPHTDEAPSSLPGTNEQVPLSQQQFVLPSVLGGWSPVTQVSGQTLLMDTSLFLNAEASVSSTHMEAFNLIGTENKPAMAEVVFGSTANHVLNGNTEQTSSGSSNGTQNSGGHIDGGSSQMYELATMGEQNEVLVSGSSGSEATGTVLQQSLADTIIAEATSQQQQQQQAEPVIELAVIEPTPHVEEMIPPASPSGGNTYLEVSSETLPPPYEAPAQVHLLLFPENNNLVQETQQEIIQGLQQSDDSDPLMQRPAESNMYTEAVNFAHSGQNQQAMSSNTVVSNNLVVQQQQEASKLQEDQHEVSDNQNNGLVAAMDQ